MVIIHMIYKHFINQKLFRTLVPDPMQNADAFFKGTRGGGVKSRVVTKKSGISARFLIAIRGTA
ncbi:MAG: hypothetical protein ACFNUL_10235, partial [Cardiobacterium hominis]